MNQLRLENKEEKLAHLQSLERIPSINPREYSKSGNYQRLDYISHGVFGTGFVEEIVDRSTIKVFFPSGVRVLKQRQYTN